MQSQHLYAQRGKVKLIASTPAGVGLQLEPIDRRFARASVGRRSASAIYFAALVSLKYFGSSVCSLLHPVLRYVAIFLGTCIV